ncbi:glycosyltransferase [Lelliottia aquatilis]|uniref:glycosyltransferase n=1 Tax=Lelliottia aquatilis TaxID=2080838 RepID=UPI00192C343E|nr:glycosyltransferase [Lelliottia aquatilis]MBL5882906.1 glycosyltransferase [Lelliottia aquatilis]
MSQHELVSILIPAYKADFFEQALQSAIDQDWPNTEIIVCDDGDNDAIRVTCEHLARSSGKPISYHKNTQRLLETGNVLHCLSHAKGKYIKFLYDDDLIAKNCISRLVKALNDNPEIVLASSRRTRIDELGNILPDIVATAFPFQQDTLLSGNDLISFLCDYQVNFIGEPSVFLCYRDDLLALGDQIFNIDNEEMPYFADAALMIKLFRKGDLAFISEPLSSFRISDSQISQMAKSQQEQVTRTYSLMPQLIKKLGWYKGSKEENQHVTIAALHSPNEVHQVNLVHALQHAMHRSAQDYHSEQITKWVESRTLPPQHQELAASFQASRAIQQSLCVFIRENGHADALERTVDSITAWQGFGLTLHPVIVGNSVSPTRYPTSVIDATVLNAVSRINDFLTASSHDWVMVLEAGEQLLVSGLLSFDLALEGASGCDAIYADEVNIVGNKITGTTLRPDFNLDLLLSNPAEMSRHWIFKRSTLMSLGGFNRMYRQAWQFEYIVRLIEQKGIQFAGHIPEPLVASHGQFTIALDEEKTILRNHLRQRGYPAGEVESERPGLYALRYHHQQQPLVSIIIPTKDQLPILVHCVTTLLEKTRYPNYEVLIVDNNSETPEALEWLNGISTIDPQRIRVLRYPHPFNYSAINNMAAREARGEYLVLLNNDTGVIENNWLDHLLNHGLRPEVGITGARLLYPSGNIQHAGVVMGLRGPADHPFINSEKDKPGYMNRLHCDQNYNVVTAACLLVRKSVYEAVGGLDEEQFRVSYNDVDFCLKVREAGYLTVWTPYSVVMHEGSVSQKSVDKATQEKKRQRFMGEQDAMYQKWLPLIANDPAYNPNLSLNNTGFQLQTDAPGTWKPLHWNPIPTLLAITAGRTHRHQQHFINQLTLFNDEAVAETLVPFVPPSIGEMARISPASLILQETISPAAQEWLERVRKATSQFTVFTLDNYLPALSAKSTLRETLTGDLSAALQATLRHTDRLVVSSPMVAETCATWHHDIRIVTPRLSPTHWDNLISARGYGHKPRIGWIGDGENITDLEIIHKAIVQLSKSVEWVLMGYCPPSLRAHVTEYHPSVTPECYPQKLASLNLDLVLEPFADTAYNRHRSVIRLLEFGACGYPVICSDNISMRNEYRVTRVKNTNNSWIEAISAYVQDPRARLNAGDALKDQVRQNGMLWRDDLSLHAAHWLA